MRIKPLLLIVAGFIYLMVPGGCNQDELCLSNQHALQTGFYSAFNVKRDSVLKNTDVYGLDFNNLIYENQDISKMFLPLSFQDDTSVFVISNNSLFDTIWVVHSKELLFISRECGFTFDFTIDTVLYTKTFVDSVALFYPKVIYGENVENVKIYLY